MKNGLFFFCFFEYMDYFVYVGMKGDWLCDRIGGLNDMGIFVVSYII